ncbi:NADH dehydrogenase [ubiquinone] 1 alpha subcomplex subunit 11 [Cimex lectularius]|uniref:NADH dehydrogenase [ubiquinone] 1 alpha subcomplex subunit 11 n=1 Tax=Cimex lectularius TaxID=79782 RepID=A0A8I6S8E3_CIMLE|nr:NADH dehydrogenase [ubiquinone] 1 alpha subcomplex subunit 11 [Cimex lectularius]
MGPISEYVFKNEYKYHDTPDGQDCFKKLWYVTKYSTLYGLVGSSIEILLNSHPKGYAATFARYGFLTGSLVGSVVTFSSTSCMFTNLRGKDDRLNYGLAGIATGAFNGAWMKSVKVGSYSAVVFAVAGIVLKDFVINKWELFPDAGTPKEVTHTYSSFSKDFTLTKDPGRTWKTPNEV